MSDEIPLHIQEEIIKRLPVVSLLQFRSVSKAWNSLIDSSDFIVAHSGTQPQHLLLKYEGPVETAETYVSFADDDAFPQQRSVTLPQSVKLLIDLSIVGSSHGLLCFHGYPKVFRPNLGTETAVLWNPSIRKSIAVAVPNEMNVDHRSDYGFGVCPVTCDPKIVQITQFSESMYHCKAKVYTLSSGKWRSLSSNLPSKSCQLIWQHIVVDRFIHWFASDTVTRDGGFHNRIMSFDTTAENFGVVDLPDNLRRHHPIQLGISKLRESLVMLEYHSIMKHACSVWMMENGVEKSFTKLFTIEAPHWSRGIRTLGFRKSGQPIIEMEMENDDDEYIEQRELVVYEPNSKHIDYLDICGTTETFFVNSYTESLVLIGRSDCNIKVED